MVKILCFILCEFYCIIKALHILISKKKATFKCHTHLDLWGTTRYNKSYYGRLYYPKWLQQDLLNSVSAYSVILTLDLSCGLGLYPFLLNLGRTLWPLGPTECGRSDTLWLLRLDQKNVTHFLAFALQGCSFGTQPSCPNWEGQTSPRGEINKGPLDMILANRVAEVPADNQHQHPDRYLQMIPTPSCWVNPPFLECHIPGILWFLAFSDWFLSVSYMLWRCLYILLWFNPSLFLFNH